MLLCLCHIPLIKTKWSQGRGGSRQLSHHTGEEAFPQVRRTNIESSPFPIHCFFFPSLFLNLCLRPLSQPRPSPRPWPALPPSRASVLYLPHQHLFYQAGGQGQTISLPRHLAEIWLSCRKGLSCFS